MVTAHINFSCIGTFTFYSLGARVINLMITCLATVFLVLLLVIFLFLNDEEFHCSNCMGDYIADRSLLCILFSLCCQSHDSVYVKDKLLNPLSFFLAVNAKKTHTASLSGFKLFYTPLIQAAMVASFTNLYEIQGFMFE